MIDGRPVAVCGLPPSGGWELTPGFPIFWARLLTTLVPAGQGSAARDASESDLRSASTGHRRPPEREQAPVMAATIAGGRPWLVLLAIALLAVRLRRRP